MVGHRKVKCREERQCSTSFAPTRFQQADRSVCPISFTICALFVGEALWPPPTTLLHHEICNLSVYTRLRSDRPGPIYRSWAWVDVRLVQKEYDLADACLCSKITLIMRSEVALNGLNSMCFKNDPIVCSNRILLPSCEPRLRALLATDCKSALQTLQLRTNTAWAIRSIQ